MQRILQKLKEGNIIPIPVFLDLLLMNLRSIPIGYAAADVTSIRDAQAKFWACGDTKVKRSITKPFPIQCISKIGGLLRDQHLFVVWRIGDIRDIWLR